MKNIWLAFFEISILTICWRVDGATTVVYDSTGGGSYNGVGPVYNSPEFIGDQFVPSASGLLDSIALPLDNDFTFNGPFAYGTLTLWSDAGNVVGTPLFSANISATYFDITSNAQLPPFTDVSADGSPQVLLTAGTPYWLTLSQTTGSGGLVCFSSVNLAAAESVYFENNTIQYSTGLQPIVAQITVDTVPEPATGMFIFVGLLGMAAASLRRDSLKHKRIVLKDSQHDT